MLDKACFSNHFVAARQYWHLDNGSYGANLILQNFKKQSSGALSGFEEIDVRVRVICHCCGAMLEHPCCENSMEVERHNDGNLFAEDDACLLQ